MKFSHGLIPPATAGTGSWWFVFHDGRLLIRDMAGAGVTVPRSGTAELFGLTPDTVQYLGTLDGAPCFAGGTTGAPARLAADCRLANLRDLHSVLDDVLYGVAVRARHLVQWDLDHHYCGRCGRPLRWKADERAKSCADCGQLQFPQIAPAVIVAVRRGDRLLLARGPRFPAGMFSVLAGFVEAGETLEECLRREVWEEAGITIANLCYFGSQPWPYPNSLMIGFTAEYASGDLRADGVELTEAGWYRADHLPELPGRLSIARALIDDFVARTH